MQAAKRFTELPILEVGERIRLKRRLDRTKQLLFRTKPAPVSYLCVHGEKYPLPYRVTNATADGDAGIDQETLMHFAANMTSSGHLGLYDSGKSARMMMWISRNNCQIVFDLVNAFGGTIVQASSCDQFEPLVRWQLTGVRASRAAKWLGSVPSKRQKLFQALASVPDLSIAERKELQCRIRTQLHEFTKATPASMSCWSQAAGLFDRVGSIILRASGGSPLTLGMEQQDRDILDALQAFLQSQGCDPGSITERTRHRHGGSSQYFTWRVHRVKPCQEIVRHMLPHLKCKKQLVELVVDTNNLADIEHARKLATAFKGRQGWHSRYDETSTPWARRLHVLRDQLYRRYAKPKTSKVTAEIEERETEVRDLQRKLEDHMLGVKIDRCQKQIRELLANGATVADC